MIGDDRLFFFFFFFYFLFQAEDGIRDLVRSRGLGDVYKRQAEDRAAVALALEAQVAHAPVERVAVGRGELRRDLAPVSYTHLTLPTSDLV